MSENDLKYFKDIMQCANINFLIGSGLSTPYLKTLGSIEKKITSLSRKKNIDESVQLLVMNSLFHQYFEDVMYKNSFIFENSFDKDKDITLNNYSEFLRTFNSLLQRRGSTILNKKVNIFTTNIDLFFEKALEDLGLEFNDGFSGRQIPVFSLSNYNKVLTKKSLYFDNESKIPIFNYLKLHGSLNWRFGDKNRIVYTNDLSYLENIHNLSLECKFLEIKDNDTIDGLIKTATKRKKQGEIEEKKICEFQKEYEKIPVINPTKDKFKESVLDFNYYELLRFYSNELEKENSVLFVMGFSMADEHIADITLRLAKSNPSLTIIVFVHIEPELAEIKKNLKNSEQKNIRFYSPIDPDVFDFKTINSSIFKLISDKIEKDE